MELLLKGTTIPLAQRNLQVASVSLIFAAAHMFSKDLEALKSGGFLQGYTPTVWAMVSLDSIGGLLVSMLLKCASSPMRMHTSTRLSMSTPPPVPMPATATTAGIRQRPSHAHAHAHAHATTAGIRRRHSRTSPRRLASSSTSFSPGMHMHMHMPVCPWACAKCMSSPGIWTAAATGCQLTTTAP